MNDKIFSTLKKLLIERYAFDEALIKPNVDLERELGLDSVDTGDLLCSVEETFRVRLSLDEMEKVHTLSDLVRLIKKKKNK